MEGGGARAPIMTAYRQQRVRLRGGAVAAGPRRRGGSPGSPRRRKILRHNVYGWFASRARRLCAHRHRSRGADPLAGALRNSRDLTHNRTAET